MRRLKAIFTAAVLVCGASSTVLSTQSFAHGGALDAHGARHAAMEAIGAHMKALSAVARGNAPVDALARGHAMSLRGLAGTVKFLFPEGPITGADRSTPAIWERWDEFVAISDDFTTKSVALMDAVEGGDISQIAAALAEVGKTCGACHTPFRGPKK